MTLTAHGFINDKQRRFVAVRCRHEAVEHEGKTIRILARQKNRRGRLTGKCLEVATRRPFRMRTRWMAATDIENPRHGRLREPRDHYNCGLSVGAKRLSNAFISGSSRAEDGRTGRGNFRAAVFAPTLDNTGGHLMQTFECSRLILTRTAGK